MVFTLQWYKAVSENNINEIYNMSGVIDVRKHQDKRIVIEVWPFKWGGQERTF